MRNFVHRKTLSHETQYFFSCQHPRSSCSWLCEEAAKGPCQADAVRCPRVWLAWPAYACPLPACYSVCWLLGPQHANPCSFALLAQALGTPSCSWSWSRPSVRWHKRLALSRPALKTCSSAKTTRRQLPAWHGTTNVPSRTCPNSLPPSPSLASPAALLCWQALAAPTQLTPIYNALCPCQPCHTSLQAQTCASRFHSCPSLPPCIEPHSTPCPAIPSRASACSTPLHAAPLPSRLLMPPPAGSNLSPAVIQLERFRGHSQPRI